MRIDILTLFPGMFEPWLGTSIPKRAAEKGLVSYHLTELRAYATDSHRSVDDRPFGGGPGMVMMAPVVVAAAEDAAAQDPRKPRIILLAPAGRPLTQPIVRELAAEERIMLIAGHYEGFDERIVEELGAEELSIGDYVLSGGELAAMVVLDAIVRTLPGALGAQGGADDESFEPEGSDTVGLLEHPNYTRPRDFRGKTVPEVLLGGDHQAVARWRRQQREVRTKERRPDVYERWLQSRSTI